MIKACYARPDQPLTQEEVDAILEFQREVLTWRAGCSKFMSSGGSGWIEQFLWQKDMKFRGLGYLYRYWSNRWDKTHAHLFEAHPEIVENDKAIKKIDYFKMPDWGTRGT